jgi:hypothetical protein
MSLLNRRALPDLDRDLRDAQFALDFITAAEMQIRTAAHVVFDRDAVQIEVMAGATVDRSAFDNILTDAMSDAFYEPRKVLEKEIERLGGQIYLRELAEDRADYHRSAAE